MYQKGEKLKGFIMKKGVFMKVLRGGFFQKKNQSKLKKDVLKIISTAEEKRNFMPLFGFFEPSIMTEKDRHDKLLETAKKYFSLKEEIEQELVL